MIKKDIYSILELGSKGKYDSLYRRLGRIDTSFAQSDVGRFALHMTILLETWSLLRLDNPDLQLGQICVAGKHMAGSRKELVEMANRVMNILHEGFFPITEQGAITLYNLIKGSDSAAFRNEEMWIGGSNALDAAYVAPDIAQIPAAFASINYAVHNHKSSLELLGRLHSFGFLLLPFQKDNARWIALWTHSMAKQLALPSTGILPWTTGILAHRQQYTHNLLACAEGHYEKWDTTWLECVESAFDSLENLMQASQKLWETMRALEDTFGKSRQHLRPLFLYLTKCPYITLRDVCQITGLTKPNASIILKRCVEVGILKQVTFERRNRVYAAESIVNTVQGC